MEKDLTTLAKLRIVALNDNGLGLGLTEIKEKMAEEGISVSKVTIYSILNKLKKYETVTNFPPPSGRRKGVTNEILDFIDA